MTWIILPSGVDETVTVDALRLLPLWAKVNDDLWIFSGPEELSGWRHALGQVVLYSEGWVPKVLTEMGDMRSAPMSFQDAKIYVEDVVGRSLCCS